MAIDSSKIYIYPVSNRKIENSTNFSIYGKLGRSNTEDNFISNYNKITDYNSFIINDLTITIKENRLNIDLGKFCIKGYIFELLHGVDFNISNFIGNDLYVYFTIEREVKQLFNLDEYELKASDINGKYTGLQINISNTEPIDLVTNSIETINFIVAHYKKENSRWVKDKSIIPYSKFKINNMEVEINDSSISTINNKTIIKDWLNNGFIVDDGEI